MTNSELDSSSYTQLRIRHIAGIRINQLTLPATSSSTSKATQAPIEGYTLDPIEAPSTPPPPSSSVSRSPRARRTSQLSVSSPDTRVRRARAPTLAGEAISSSPVSGTVGQTLILPHLHGGVDDQKSRVERRERALARCFVALCLVPALPTEVEFSLAPRKLPSSRSKASKAIPATSAVVGSIPSPRTQRTIQPSRARTSSLPTPPTPTTSPSLSATGTTASASLGVRRVGLSRHDSRPGSSRRSTLGPARSSSDAGSARKTPASSSPSTPDSPIITANMAMSGSPSNSVATPFFFSTIHRPSTHPRFDFLEPGDFAPWLTVDDAAGTVVDVQVWAEIGGSSGAEKWKRLSGIGGVVDFSRLMRRSAPLPEICLPSNTLEWTFSTDPKAIYYCLPPVTSSASLPAEVGVADDGSAVERSMRETRMKRGVGVGGLHQLVNIQAVIADTRRSVEDLRRSIDFLITSDADRSAIAREISERSLRLRWVQDRVGEVERAIEEAKARIILRRSEIERRRNGMVLAAVNVELDRSRAVELETYIQQVESERSSILPMIYRLRASHAQALDSLFPIVPLHPPSLLYSIIGVPLPIPTGIKDPAPPLTLPPSLTPASCPKVDERTTSAALGYAALVVHILALLGGAAAGLAYPVTYAGSRSHVRDVVSVMQGPRSFPLYAKGVERYRYEYAVFLLNKDIELLMNESDIRVLDTRHTLPNLKNLLLTLSSPTPPPPGPVTGPGWVSGASSRTSSRQTSSAWTWTNPSNLGNAFGLGLTQVALTHGNGSADASPSPSVSAPESLSVVSVSSPIAATPSIASPVSPSPGNARAMYTNPRRSALHRETGRAMLDSVTGEEMRIVTLSKTLDDGEQDSDESGGTERDGLGLRKTKGTGFYA